MITYGDEIINQARAKIGCKETKVNAAACIYEMRAEIGLPLANEPWCAVFVLYCVKLASWRFGQISPFNKTASALNVEAQAKAKGMLIDKRPAKGSLFVYNRTGGGHIGIVDSISSDKLSFYTFEGNHNNEVSTVKRSLNGGENYRFIHVEQWINYSVPELSEVINPILTAGGLIGAYLGVRQLMKSNGKRKKTNTNARLQASRLQ